MKNLFKILFAITLINVMLLTGCKEDNPEPVTGDDFVTLTTYMSANSMDLPDVLSGWIVGAPAAADAAAFIASYHIIDIRESDAYATSHIEGAVNSTLGGVLAAAEGATKPILVVCYTGQGAGHAVVGLRLSGHTDAKVLKWGMSGWTEATSGPWAGATGDAAVGNNNWSATNTTQTDATFDAPALSATATDGAGILAERVTAMLTGGFKGVTNASVLATPADYHINNYWAEADVDHYGHISSAYRTSPLAIANITTLDPSATVVTYCWTGQTSSMITSYLSVLGYNTASLKFGTNGMIYSELESHKYTVPTVDLPVVE
jgi:rhodanese-related sulfurtransferase